MSRACGLVGRSWLSYEQFRALDTRNWRSQLENELARAGASVRRREEELRIQGPGLESWHREYLKQQLLKERVRYSHAYAGTMIASSQLATRLLQYFLDQLDATDPSLRIQPFERLAAYPDLANLWNEFAHWVTPIALRALEAHMRDDLRVPILRLVHSSGAG